MSRTPPGRTLVTLFWRLYIGLGAISSGVGAVLLIAPHLLFPAARIETVYARVIGAVFLVFGMTRIINAIVQLRRFGASSARRPKNASG